MTPIWYWFHLYFESRDQHMASGLVWALLHPGRVVSTAKGPHHHLCWHHELPRPLQVWTSGLSQGTTSVTGTDGRQRVLCLTWKLNFTDLKKKKAAEEKQHGEHYWESYHLPTSTRHLCAHLHLFLIHAFGPRDGVEGAIDVPDHQIHSDSNITLEDEKSLWNQQVFPQVIGWSAWTQYHAHVLKLLENKNKNDAFHTKNIWTSRLLRSGSLLWSLAAPWLL